MTEMVKRLRVLSEPGTIPVTGNLIGGRWEVSGAGRFLEVVSTATGQIIGHVQT